MSETDEGSTGFELLDEENPAETTATPPKSKNAASPQSKQPKPKKGDQNTVVAPKPPTAESKAATPKEGESYKCQGDFALVVDVSGNLFQ